MQWICLRKRKVYKSASSSYHFHNEENLYSVVSMKVIETNETYDEKVMINGHFPRMHEDEVFTLTGHFKDHPKYGKQYLVETFKKELPQTKAGMVQYLASDLFKGIGKRTAEKLWTIWGTCYF